ncbi:MAG: prephenate dehydrogenase [Flavobacteriaceae bacterium]|nr:prephenate dehydrogenase [Flavobacteriaceae bacterium]
MKLYIIGVGLIGGSFVLDLKNFGDYQVIGIDNDNENLKIAIKRGIIDKVGSLNNINEADIIILSTPVDISLKIILNLLDSINNRCLIFDVGSTKQTICDLVENHPKRNQFLATHPIAGTEFSGSKSAVLGLFKNKTQILCEVNKTRKDLLNLALEKFSLLGMIIREMTPSEHDNHMAYVSHLSHISSFMLGKTVLDFETANNILDLAGSGFESTVRLAKSSSEMWTPILLQNKKNIIKTLNIYISNLENFKNYLNNNNKKNISEEIKFTNQLTNILNGIVKNKNK